MKMHVGIKFFLLFALQSGDLKAIFQKLDINSIKSIQYPLNITIFKNEYMYFNPKSPFLSIQRI